MSTESFFEALRRVQALGFDVELVQYDRKRAFGSWHIDLAAPGPRRRLVWDGKERQFRVDALSKCDHWAHDWTGPRDGDLESALEILSAPS